MNKNLKSKKLNTNKGITLIALIITIIVLLILAVVAIRAVQGDGILAHARNARDKWKEATANEEEILQNYTDYIAGQIKGTEENYPQIAVNTEAKVNSTINGKKPSATNPVIPAGFEAFNAEEDDDLRYKAAKWDVEGGPEVDNGLIITDGISEFVWVPIKKTILSYREESTDYEEPEVITGVDPSTGADSASGTEYDAVPENLTQAGCTEDLNEDGKVDAYDFKIQLTKEFNAMVASVDKYGGFYVGACETCIDGSGKARSCYSETSAYNSTDENNWYGLYRVQKEYSTDSVQGSMIWECQYNAMMEWMGDAVNLELGDKRNQTRECGASSDDNIKNVLDLYGNSYEWTIGVGSYWGRQARGGKWRVNHQPCYRNHRNCKRPADLDGYFGSRLTLYII